MLTQKEVKWLFDYDSKTGNFIRKVKRGNQRVGTIAGAMSYGYIQIGIDGIHYLAHRLVWLYIHGYMPENQIDHINRNKSDNRLCNLREVNQSCNNRNMNIRCDNTSRVKGICWNSNEKKWMAYITINSKNKYLGIHDDFTEAVAHRLAAEQCLNWQDCDSSSPAYQYVKGLLC